MKNYTTFTKMEALLHTAIGLPGRSIKDIAAVTAIKPNTPYKWKSSGKGHLSPEKADRLLLYFTQNEPERLASAALLQEGNTIFYKENTSVLSSLNRGNETEE